MRKLLDPELLDAIEALPGQPFDSSAWRVTWANRDPLAGSSAGGRWSPAGEFEVLYTSLEEDGAMAEVYYHLSKAPVFSSSHGRMNELRATLGKVLVVSAERLRALGIDAPLAPRIDAAPTQAIGSAAHMLDFEGLIVPSARWACSNLILFLDRIDVDRQLALLGSSDVNWPAWRERSQR